MKTQTVPRSLGAIASQLVRAIFRRIRETIPRPLEVGAKGSSWIIGLVS